MRIAYSCAGEGFGHVARMVALRDDLAARHKLELFVPSSVEPFVRERLPDAKLRPIPYFGLSKRDNRILYGSTLVSAIRLAVHFIPEIGRLSRLLRRLKIDVVLSDFEPYLPWAARLANIPIVQMNHPGVVSRFVDFDPRSWVSAIAARLMQGPWDRRLLISFYGGDVGPLIRHSLLSQPIRDDGFLVVNLKDDARRRVMPILDAVEGLSYRLFPSQGANFDEALASCSAVVTTAGHQTLSEALSLGKPVLALPQDGQFEQLLNARMLERTGRGSWCAVRDLPTALPHFLSRLVEYRAPRILEKRFRLRDSRLDLLGTLDARFAALRGERIAKHPFAIRVAG